VVTTTRGVFWVVVLLFSLTFISHHAYRFSKILKQFSSGEKRRKIVTHEREATMTRRRRKK